MHDVANNTNGVHWYQTVRIHIKRLHIISNHESAVYKYLKSNTEKIARTLRWNKKQNCLH